MTDLTPDGAPGSFFIFSFCLDEKFAMCTPGRTNRNMTHSSQTVLWISHIFMLDFLPHFKLIQKCFFPLSLGHWDMCPDGEGASCSPFLPSLTSLMHGEGRTVVFLPQLGSCIPHTGPFFQLLEPGAKIKEGRAIRQQFICKCGS